MTEFGIRLSFQYGESGNARNFPGEVLAALIEGTEVSFNHSSYGIDVKSGGGETADVGDITSTVAVDSCAVAMPKIANH